ncbi:MAG: ATPase [Chloroflexi bacterium]|nr:ATPase [Chloroflexota bacterium]
MAIDVLHLIDRLESLVTSGVRIPLSSKSLIDEQEFLDIVDQLRVAIPDEIKQANRVNSERENVIGHAKSEADKIVSNAQEQAAFMLKDSELVNSAQQRAQSVLAEAERRAEEIRVGADSYALDVLSGLENELTRLLAQVRKGRASLERTVKESPRKDTRQPDVATSARAPIRESYRVIE